MTYTAEEHAMFAWLKPYAPAGYWCLDCNSLPKAAGSTRCLDCQKVFYDHIQDHMVPDPRAIPPRGGRDARQPKG